MNIKKLGRTLGVVIVLTFGAIGLIGAINPEPAAPRGADVGSTIGLDATAPFTPDLGAPATECDGGDPLALPGQQQQACCIDQCHRDRDCRFICGKEFGGQCVQVNSCCRECFCLGFAPGPGLPS
jgi:hypothetical protein